MSSDVFNKFDKAERVELAAARLYRALAAKFESQTEIAKTLSALAGEEDQHALRVRMLRDRYAKRPSAFEDIPVDETELDGLLSEAAELEKLFDREPLTISVEEAKAFLIALEERFSAAHARAMAACASPELRSFFEQLAKQDTAHAKVLAELAISAAG